MAFIHFLWGNEAQSVLHCRSAELTENELAKPTYLSYTAKRGCTQWSGYFTPGIGTLGYFE